MKAVNLLPAEGRRGVGGVGVGRSEGAAYGVLALLGGLALLALVYGVARHQVSSRRSQLATVSARTQRVQESTSALSSYTSFNALREQRVNAVNELIGSRFDWAHALHELGRVMPAGTSISTLTGAIGAGAAGAAAPVGVAPTSTATTAPPPSAAPSAAAPGAGVVSTVTSATPPGSVPTITLGGCATSQAKVAQALLRLRLIDGVSKVTLQSSVKASATGAGVAAGSGSGCTGDAAFSAQLTFQALPAVSPTANGGTQLTSSTGSQR
jgi:hypothetical protein